MRQAKHLLFAAAFFPLLAAGCTQNAVVDRDSTSEKPMEITSPAFGQNQDIPPKYTCDGENINPPLAFAGVPADAKSLVLVVDDPDAPGRTWAHWIVYNIDPASAGIAENSVPAGARQGITDFGIQGYGGPCPPSGKHRYFFKLYALDSAIDVPISAAKKDLEKAMEGRILVQSDLIGLYQKK